MSAVELVGLHKGDGQMHLAVQGEATTSCHRQLQANRWCSLHEVPADVAAAAFAHLAARDGRTWLGGPCRSCARALGL